MTTPPTPIITNSSVPTAPLNNIPLPQAQATPLPSSALQMLAGMVDSRGNGIVGGENNSSFHQQKYQNIPYLQQGSPSTIQPRPQYISEQNAYGRTAQRRAGMNAFLGNLTNMVNYHANENKEKQIRQASVNWERLNAAIQSGDQKTINDILGDKKVMKQMAQALNMNFLNPEQGSDNPYRRALNGILTKIGLQHKQAQPAATPQSMAAARNAQIQRLRAAMGTQPPGQQQLQQQAWATLLNDPRGIAAALADPKNVGLLGAVGMNSTGNAVLNAQARADHDASVQTQKDMDDAIKAYKIDSDNQIKIGQLQLAIQAHHDKERDYNTTQQNLAYRFDLNLKFKYASLAQQAARTAVGAQRNAIQGQMNSINKFKADMGALDQTSKQLLTRQATITRQMDSIITSQTATSSGALWSSKTKESTDAANKQIAALQGQLNSVDAALKKIGSQRQKIYNAYEKESGENLGFSDTGDTGAGGTTDPGSSGLVGPGSGG